MNLVETDRPVSEWLVMTERKMPPAVTKTLEKLPEL
jgi:hypothetical protein